MARGTESTKEIRKVLKSHGISSRQVSVRYDGSINCRIKDISVDPELVEKAARRHESYRYCEYSQEILQGGNTFVFVNYDWETRRDVLATEEGQELVARLTSHLEQLKDGQGMEFDGKHIIGKNFNRAIYVDEIGSETMDTNKRFHGVQDVAFFLLCKEAISNRNVK